MMSAYANAEARVKTYADRVGVEPPSLLSDDGAPTPELLSFCDRFGVSLDWIFRGTPKVLCGDGGNGKSVLALSTLKGT